MSTFPHRPKISANSLLLKRAMDGVHPSAVATAPSDRRKVAKTPPEVEGERVEDEEEDDLRSVIVSHRSSKQKEERKREMSDRHINTEEEEEEDILPAKKVKQSLVFDNEGEGEREGGAVATLKEKAIKRWASCVESVCCFTCLQYHSL